LDWASAVSPCCGAFWKCATASEALMLNYVIIAVTAFAFVYLVYVMLRPEKF
jgi:K+-transporting ATPase KdpF subunit